MWFIKRAIRNWRRTRFALLAPEKAETLVRGLVALSKDEDEMYDKLYAAGASKISIHPFSSECEREFWGEVYMEGNSKYPICFRFSNYLS